MRRVCHHACRMRVECISGDWVTLSGERTGTAHTEHIVEMKDISLTHDVCLCVCVCVCVCARLEEAGCVVVVGGVVLVVHLSECVVWVCLCVCV